MQVALTRKPEEKKSRAVPEPREEPELSTEAVPGASAGVPLFLRRLGQAKLRVNEPGDVWEQEADRVAEQVMRMPDPMVQRKCAACASGGSVCSNCEDEEKTRIQRKPDGIAHIGEVAPDFVSRLGTGAPLDSESRAFFEPRFGRDFGDVRVQTGAQAEAAASAVSARAYTIGNDIVLGTGEYSPQTSEGRHLLAHELTHVLQQGGGARPSVMRLTEPRVNPAEYEFVPIAKGGTWDAVSILDRISQREYTQTRIAKSQPGEGTESDPYRCGPSAVLASAIVAGPKAVKQLCVNLYKRIVEWRERAKKDDKAFREKQRAARRAGADPDAVQKEVPSYDVCDRAAKTVFDIHWNLETGILHGSHEGGSTLTFADLDRLSGYLYMFTFDTKSEWRLDAEAARKATSPDDLKLDVRSRLEPLFEKQKKDREEERRGDPNLGALTWRQFSWWLSIRARFRTESEIGDAAEMAGYAAAKRMIRSEEVGQQRLDWFLDQLKPGESLLGMWGPHTYTFLRAQDKKIYLYDSWRGAIDESAAVPTFEAANSLHERGSAEYEERIQKGLTGKDQPIRLLLRPADWSKLMAAWYP